MLDVLQEVEGVETHLVMSPAAKKTIVLETELGVSEVEALASEVHGFGDIAASLSSGSYKTTGMVVIPCSMKTLSGIANAYSDNLLLRAADVALKDRRKLVLVVRETPLHLGHLRLMAQVAEMGAILMPPMPAFYHRPENDRRHHQSNGQPCSRRARHRAGQGLVHALGGSSRKCVVMR